MATVLFLNNYQTTLGAALSSTATTMTVSSTTGLPSSLASGQFIPMTLTPASSPGSAYEIVYVTGISGSTLTVERGQEGTSALNWNTGDILYSTNTAQTTGTSMGSPSTDFQTNTLTASGLITANGGLTVPSGQTETVAGTLDVTGTIAVPNATASNQPPALGQLLNTYPIVANNAIGSGTTISVTSASFPAPSDGFAVITGYVGNNSATQDLTCSLSSSLSGLVILDENTNDDPTSTLLAYLPMTAGQSSTFSGTITVSTADTLWIKLYISFVPNP